MLALAAEQCGYGDLLALSAVGDATSTKSVRAALLANRPVSFRYGGGRRGQGTYDKDGSGYRTFVRSVGYRTFHLVAIAKKETFLPSADDEALWQHLVKVTTTPILRGWVPELRCCMEQEKRIRKAYCVGGINAATVNIDDATLDDLVRRHIKAGRIKFNRGDR